MKAVHCIEKPCKGSGGWTYNPPLKGFSVEIVHYAIQFFEIIKMNDLFL